MSKPEPVKLQEEIQFDMTEDVSAISNPFSSSKQDRNLKELWIAIDLGNG